jgi:hypothetical protein
MCRESGDEFGKARHAEDLLNINPVELKIIAEVPNKIK